MGQEQARVTGEEAKEIREAGTVDTRRVLAARQAGSKLTSELNDLLDEIDEVLEENAAEFVRSYVQKGGE